MPSPRRHRQLLRDEENEAAEQRERWCCHDHHRGAGHGESCAVPLDRHRLILQVFSARILVRQANSKVGVICDERLDPFIWVITLFPW